MRGRVVDLDVPTIGTVRLRLYHECATFHCGSAIGPSVLARWWAERVAGSWVYLWDSDNVRHEFALATAIDNELDPDPVDLAREAQDARYEMPDA
jgi:hypothetical protein